MAYDINSLEFRPLKASEIEVRVGTVGGKGATLLLYQDSRCAMNLLDETVGKGNWQRDHKEVKGNMYAGIGIWDYEKEQWVWKWDCGVESNTEKEKGEASDAMKRASVNWGIGRELYTSPFIFVPCETVSKQGGRGYELKDKFMFSGTKVSHITYNGNREVCELVIEDKNGVPMYQYPRGFKPGLKRNSEFTPANMITVEQADAIKHLLIETNTDTKQFLAYVAKKTNDSCDSVDGMTAKQYEVAQRAIEAKIKKMEEGQK